MPEEKDPSIIIDTSSLIALYKLDLISILKDLFTSIFAPECVVYEFGQDLPSWIQILPSSDISLTASLNEKLGDGETEVIALGIEKNGLVLVLDDLEARKAAKKLGLKITGLLGILLKAKRRKKISKIKPFLEKLDQENFRISNELKNEVLEIAGEI